MRKVTCLVEGQEGAEARAHCVCGSPWGCTVWTLDVKSSKGLSAEAQLQETAENHEVFAFTLRASAAGWPAL